MVTDKPQMCKYVSAKRYKMPYNRQVTEKLMPQLSHIKGSNFFEVAKYYNREF